MKNILRTGVLVSAALLSLSTLGNAQVSRQYFVHIPFDFTVGGKLLKAGEYRIAPLGGSTNQRAVILESRANGEGKVIGQAAIESTESSRQGRITFAKVSDQWRLREVETAGFTLKLKTPAEGESTVASAGKPEETKTIGLNR